MEQSMMQVLVLLLVASLVGMGARRLHLPYTLALVLAGIGIGFFEVESLAKLHLTPELLLAIFLPALLFEAAYHVEFKKFRKDAPATLLMAVPGVLVAVAITAFTVWGSLQLLGFEGFELGHSFLLASMIAATDPISVLALFRSLGVTKRLYLLMEGESLLNDGVAVVVFVIIAAVLGIQTGHGEAPDLATTKEIAVYGIRTFLWMVGVGVAVGAVLGMIVSVLTRQIDDRLVEVTLSFLLAYGSFLAAEHLHASGVLACVTAGIVLGSFGSRYGMSATTRLAIADFWEFMAFFSNSFVFLLVGLELDVPTLMSNAGWVLIVFFCVLLGRAAAVYGALPLTRFFGIEKIPAGWNHIMLWGGLRGSLSMVLVIGLPQDFAQREFLLILVFGVVSASLFIQGLTIGPLLKYLGITKDQSHKWAYERARGRALMAAQAQKELERQSSDGIIQVGVRNRLSTFYANLQKTEETAAAELAGTGLDAERLQEAALHLLSIEEDTLRHAVSDGIVSEDAASELFKNVAQRRETLRYGDHNPDKRDEVLSEILGPE